MLSEVRPRSFGVAASSANSYLECINFSHDMMPSSPESTGLLTVTVRANDGVSRLDEQTSSRAIVSRDESAHFSRLRSPYPVDSPSHRCRRGQDDQRTHVSLIGWRFIAV